jgi:hypothetical protein
MEEATRKVLFAVTHEIITKHNANPNATFKMAHNEFSAKVYFIFYTSYIKNRINNNNLAYDIFVFNIFMMMTE